jgi:predicted site-specific integrase-resolvase
METTYTIGQMATKLHKGVKTLQRWDRAGILSAQRSPTGRRYYTHRQLLQYYGDCSVAPARSIVAYCRVSSQAQKPDLKNQRRILETFCGAKGYANVAFLEEIGGGMNFKRKLFRQLLTDVHGGKIAKIIVAHKDRLTRFGYEHILWECACYHCEIEVLNNEQASPEQEMVQDLMTIVHCFSSRLYGLRNYKKTLKAALK